MTDALHAAPAPGTGEEERWLVAQAVSGDREAARQGAGGLQVGLHRHVIDTRGEDLCQVIERGERLGHGANRRAALRCGRGVQGALSRAHIIGRRARRVRDGSPQGKKKPQAVKPGAESIL